MLMICKDGSRIINRYKLCDMIGRGAYGCVYRAITLEQPSLEVAVKEFGKTRLRKTNRQANFRRPPGRGGRPPKGVYGATQQITQKELDSSVSAMSNIDLNSEEKEKTDDPLLLIRHEIAILKKLHHPYLVQLYEVLDDPTKDGLYMVFEYCPYVYNTMKKTDTQKLIIISRDGPVIDVKIHQQVQPLDEDTAREYFTQIMLGVEYLHFHNIVHRDIKPDNVLLQNERRTCKIVDFGVSEFFLKPGDDTMQKSTGSPAFMSPEVCKAGHGDFHGKQSDVWSMGVTFYCMVVGHLPFDKDHFLELYESIQQVEPEYPDHLSPLCKDFLQAILCKDPSKRLTIDQMRQHPFITKNGDISITNFDENVQEMVIEVTEEELDTAIIKIASVFTLARAISKFKRAGSRASSSGSLTDVTANVLSKGKDALGIEHNSNDSERNESRNETQEEKTKMMQNSPGANDASSPLALEHVAEAHLVVGSSDPKRVISKIERDSPHDSNRKEEESNDERRPIPASKTSVSSTQEEDRETPEAQDYFQEGKDYVQDGNVRKPKVLRGLPTVSSPAIEDLPIPDGAAPAYEGKRG